MTNNNCLEGVKCPQCGQEDKFHIAANIVVEVTDDGTEDLGGNYEWGDDSYCECCGCGHKGVLANFHIEQRLLSPLEALENMLGNMDENKILKACRLANYALEAPRAVYTNAKRTVKFYREQENEKRT